MMTGLCETVDRVNESFFYGKPISAGDGGRIVRFIQSRLGKPGSYAGMPAPTERDLRGGIRLFTGETPSPRSGRHILGEEACRALLLLGGKSKAVREALAPVDRTMGEVLGRHYQPGMKYPDFFCCPKCTCGLLRHLSAGGLKKQEAWLEKGLKGIRSMRDGKGGWNLFSFHYTLYTLLDIDTPSAGKELAYAAVRCEKEAARKAPAGNIYSQRRLDVVKKALGSRN